MREREREVGQWQFLPKLEVLTIYEAYVRAAAMDLLQRLDAQVLSRTLSWLPQRQALQLMILASDWVKLVAAHLRRLATWTMGEVGADFF